MGDSLVYLDFEGNTLDKSGNGNNAIISGSPAVGDGFVGKGYKFNGNGDYMYIPQLQVPGSITLSFWIKSDYLGYPIPISIDGESYNSGPNLFFALNKISWNKGDSAQNLLKEGYPDSNWHQFTIVNDNTGKIAMFYIDGIYSGNASSLDATSNAKDSGNVFIGSWHNKGYYFNGFMDEVRIYDKVLSAVEVKEIYDNDVEGAGEETTCTDSDGGLNYYVKGNTYLTEPGVEHPVWSDSCQGSYLSEQYCDGSVVKTDQAYLCPNGCVDGACVVGGSSQFYKDLLNLSADGDCNAFLKSGNLPNGVSYTARIGCYNYMDSVVEKFVQLSMLDGNYNLDSLVGHNIVASMENQTVMNILDSCDFVAKPWGSEGRWSVNITPDNVYYNLFVGEGLPVPSAQTIDFHQSYERYCSSSYADQKIYADALDNFGTSYDIINPSFTMAVLVWGWQSYSSIGTCDSVRNLIENPYDLVIDEKTWEVAYDDDGSGPVFYAGWSYVRPEYSNENHYVWASVAILPGADGDMDISPVEQQLNIALEQGLCDKQRVYFDDDSSQIVYACKNIWRLASEAQRVSPSSAWNYNNDVVVLWFNDNKLFNMEFSLNDYYTCYSSEECAQMEQWNHQRGQEDLIRFTDSLINNRGQWSGANIDYMSETFVKYFLSACPSEVQEDEWYVGSWSCRVEPVICPPHGEQTEVCTRYNENLGSDEKREASISCNPGICSGCYIPKWFGSATQSKCIPYGFRFEHEFDSFEEEFYEENYEEMNVAEFNREMDGFMSAEVVKAGEVTLRVNREWEGIDDEAEYSVSIFPDVVDGDYDVYYLSAGDKADITFKEFAGAREETVSVALGDIKYNSIDPNASVVSLIFGYSGTRTSPLKMNAYCDISGLVREQKTKNADGGWANCQNSYECGSNLCSHGECVELFDMFEDVNVFREIFVKVICKLANLFDVEEYNSCMYNALGGEAPSSSGGGGGGGSVSSGPPVMPE